MHIDSVLLTCPELLACHISFPRASLISQLVKNPPAMQETPVQFLSQEYLLEKGQATHYSWNSLVTQLVKDLPAMWEKGKATHSRILAWRIPWTLQSMGSQRVRHDWATFTYHFPGNCGIMKRNQLGKLTFQRQTFISTNIYVGSSLESLARLFKTLMLRPHARPVNSESQAVGLRQQQFLKLPRGFR